MGAGKYLRFDLEMLLLSLPYVHLCQYFMVFLPRRGCSRPLSCRNLCLFSTFTSLLSLQGIIIQQIRGKKGNVTDARNCN